VRNFASKDPQRYPSYTEEEVLAELKTAREEMDEAELVMNDLTNARNEIVALKEELSTVKTEKLALQSQLDVALVNAKDNQEALQAALARIDELVSEQESIPLWKKLLSGGKAADGNAADGTTAAPVVAKAVNDPGELVGQRVVVQDILARELNGQQGLVTQWIPADKRLSVRLDSAGPYAPPLTLKPSSLKCI
jgi:hypothetical protein